MRFKGEVWRHIPAGAHPLHTGYILQANGRWNRPGKYGCLYTALTRQGAEAEFLKYLAKAGTDPSSIKPRDLVTIQADIQPVLDLTTKQEGLVDPSAPFLSGDDPADWEKCRKIADVARLRGHAGLLVPSAALSGEKNLIIYIDGTARNIQLDVGSQRIPLNYNK